MNNVVFANGLRSQEGWRVNSTLKVEVANNAGRDIPTISHSQSSEASGHDNNSCNSSKCTTLVETAGRKSRV